MYCETLDHIQAYVDIAAIVIFSPLWLYGIFRLTALWWQLSKHAKSPIATSIMPFIALSKRAFEPVAWDAHDKFLSMFLMMICGALALVAIVFVFHILVPSMADCEIGLSSSGQAK